MTKDRKILLLQRACDKAHHAIVKLAYLASDMACDTGGLSNEPFNVDGYAYKANRKLESVLKETRFQA